MINSNGKPKTHETSSHLHHPSRPLFLSSPPANSLPFQYNLKGVIRYIITLMQGGNPLGQDFSFLQCYICFQNVKKPRMCPSCSKLACHNCLRTWIEQSKPQCPHCRKPLLLGSFADCERFVNDVRHLFSQMDSNERLKEKCQEHRIQMTYYCEDCKDAICSDCGMFGRHRTHKIIHLSKVYQENKNKILNELAKFDNKIELFRKNGVFVKNQLQKLASQVSQKKNFIEEYFVTLIERLDEEYKDKKEKIEGKLDECSSELEFLQKFRDDVCQELQCKSEKELITKSQDFINCIQSICDKELLEEEQSYSFDTIHELVPKYAKFYYVLKNYSQLPDSIVYSDPCELNGMQWRLKIYPKGNGGAKNTHLSVFLELSKGYQNENKYEYKIELMNHLLPKESTIREYSSKFDIGECWGYNQFIAIPELSNGYLDEAGSLHFQIGVRNPTYRSLVRDQEKYIQVLQNRLNCIENPQPQLRREKMNELAQALPGMPDSRVFAEKSEEEHDHSHMKEEQEEVKVEQHLESDHYEEANSERSNIRFLSYK